MTYEDKDLLWVKRFYHKPPEINDMKVMIFLIAIGMYNKRKNIPSILLFMINYQIMLFLILTYYYMTSSITYISHNIKHFRHIALSRNDSKSSNFWLASSFPKSIKFISSISKLLSMLSLCNVSVGKGLNVNGE